MLGFNAVDSSRVNLVPEYRLIEHMSPLWRRRFEKAIGLLLYSIDQPFDWANIAKQCSVSASHFHYMFKQVFGEAPAQYQRRLRLQQVAFDLYFQREKSVTEIAHESGFSSSQALAKALKRELGISASEVRENFFDSFDNFLKILGHPSENATKSVEQYLTESLDFSVVAHKEQHFLVKKSSTTDLTRLGSEWLAMAPKNITTGVTISHWDAVMDPSSLDFQLGYKVDEQGLSNVTLPGRKYLCARANVSAGSSYISAWNAIYKHIIKEGMQPDFYSPVIECLHNARSNNEWVMDITIKLPLQTTHI